MLSYFLASALLLSASLQPVLAGAATKKDKDDGMETGKVVAWVIAALMIVILAVLVLTYCICAKMILREEKQSKQYARAMSLTKMMRSQISRSSKAVSSTPNAISAFGGSTAKPEEK